MLFAGWEVRMGELKGGTNTAKPHRMTWKTANCIEINQKFLNTTNRLVQQLKIKTSTKPHQKLSKTASLQTLMPPLYREKPVPEILKMLKTAG